MPIYSFRCPSCETIKEVLFKSLPSPIKQKQSPCDNCDGVMVRDHGAEPIHVVGGTHFDTQRTVDFAMGKTDQGGRQVPVYKDGNGHTQEVRNTRDVEKWMKGANQLGKPRMVEWTNSITGEKSWVPQRTVMRADPKTGEQMDAGTIIRESAKLVPLTKEFTMPTVIRSTNERIDPKRGVVVKKPVQPGRHSKHCMCVACCMTSDKNEVMDGGYRGGVDASHFLPKG